MILTRVTITFNYTDQGAVCKNLKWNSTRSCYIWDTYMGIVKLELQSEMGK